MSGYGHKKDCDCVLCSERGWSKGLKLGPLPQWWKNRISNSLKGILPSDETKKKFSKLKMGNKNPMWKGDSAGFHALHMWIKHHKPKPKLCEECKQKPPFDLTNISQKYKRDVNDYEWLCRGCHMKKDGRLDKLKKCHIGKPNPFFRKNNPMKNKKVVEKTIFTKNIRRLARKNDHITLLRMPIVGV